MQGGNENAWKLAISTMMRVFISEETIVQSRRDLRAVEHLLANLF